MSFLTKNQSINSLRKVLFEAKDYLKVCSCGRLSTEVKVELDQLKVKIDQTLEFTKD